MIMNNEKSTEFVNRLIDMTMNNSLVWKHYSDGDINFKDDFGVFFHTEFCTLDSSKSFFTILDTNFIILAFETITSAIDGSFEKEFRLLVGEDGKHGYISEVKFDDDPYALLSELSYHIKDSMHNADEKADAFINAVLNNQIL